MPRTKPSIQLVEDDPQEADLICELDEYPPLLEGIKYVDAQCIKIEKKFFWGKREGYEFTFRVVEPEEHQGQKLVGFELPMYVNLGKWWGEKRRPRTSAKAAKIAQVAGCPKRFKKSAFMGKIFRCLLKKTSDEAAPYTIIETVVKKVAG